MDEALLVLLLSLPLHRDIQWELHRVEPILGKPAKVVCSIERWYDNLGGHRVQCSLSLADGRVVWHKYLPLARPATDEECWDAIVRWRKHRVPEILKSLGLEIKQ